MHWGPSIYKPHALGPFNLQTTMLWRDIALVCSISRAEPSIMSTYHVYLGNYNKQCSAIPSWRTYVLCPVHILNTLQY